MTSSRLITLRFRDIEVELGETVRQHRLQINSDGYVWWGWLFRNFERNPAGALEEIRRNSSEPFDVALYDTGQGRVYRAACVSIVTALRPRRSPSLDHTPPYYRTREAPAWFKLTEIELAPEGFLLGRTCIEMPSASDECHVDLGGQMVTRLRDLRRQEVTMWVLGPKSTGVGSCIA